MSTTDPYSTPLTHTSSDATRITGTVIIEVGPAGKAAVNTLQLPVNPDQQHDIDVRVTTYQSESGAYFDDYGLGLEKMTLTGSTAWTSNQGQFNEVWCDGHQAAGHLYRDIITYYFQQEQGNSSPQNMEMTIFDSTSGNSWHVKPISPGLTLTRTKDDPLVYHYTAYFVILWDLANGPAPSVLPDPVQQALSQAVGGGFASPVPQSIAPNYSIPPSAVTKAVVAAQAVAQTPPNKYTVKSGDTLSSIAATWYAGNGSLWTLIFNANSSTLKNPNLIYAGQVLIIPPGPGANKAA